MQIKEYCLFLDNNNVFDVTVFKSTVNDKGNLVKGGQLDGSRLLLRAVSCLHVDCLSLGKAQQQGLLHRKV